MLERAHKGAFRKISPKHLERYVTEFTGRHNVREADTRWCRWESSLAG